MAQLVLTALDFDGYIESRNTSWDLAVSGSNFYVQDAAMYIFVGHNQDEYGVYEVMRSWIWFDMSSLPSGATILGVTLQFYVSGVTGVSSFNPLNVICMKVTNPSLPLQGSMWGTVPSDPQPGVGVSSTGTKQIAVGSTNYPPTSGYAVYRLLHVPPTSAPQTGKYIRVYASEVTNDDRRPKLIVDYYKDVYNVEVYPEGVCEITVYASTNITYTYTTVKMYGNAGPIVTTSTAYPTVVPCAASPTGNATIQVNTVTTKTAGVKFYGASGLDVAVDDVYTDSVTFSGECGLYVSYLTGSTEFAPYVCPTGSGELQIMYTYVKYTHRCSATFCGEMSPSIFPYSDLVLVPIACDTVECVCSSAKVQKLRCVQLASCVCDRTDVEVLVPRTFSDEASFIVSVDVQGELDG